MKTNSDIENVDNDKKNFMDINELKNDEPESNTGSGVLKYPHFPIKYRFTRIELPYLLLTLLNIF